MPRSLPVEIPQISLPPPRQAFLSEELQVVTPLVGGGATPSVPDREAPVRGPSVRGQLRFWWRACFGNRYQTAAELFEAEAAVWGRTHRKGLASFAPSAVEVRVTTENVGRLEPCARGAYPDYALWPFQGKLAGEKPANVAVGVKFRLELLLAPSAPTADRARFEMEARTAFWAWATFGGVGARTRRGCGSLFAPSLTAGRRLPDALLGPPRPGAPLTSNPRSLDIPILPGAQVLWGPKAPNAVAAWRTAITWLADYRQKLDFARNRNPDGNHPYGRSRWPEPDALRRLIPINDQQHPARQAMPDFYPRADLGLPIIFQQMTPRGQEPELSIDRDGATRFASPVICKALTLGPNESYPLIVILNTPHVWEVAPNDVKVKQKLGGAVRTFPVSRNQLDNPAHAAAVSPLLGKPNAREGLAEYVRQSQGVSGATL